MARIPSIYERAWPTVLLSPITVSDYIVTVPTTKNLHTKQIITLRLGVDAEEFEIKRVLNENQIQVGRKGQPIHVLENPVSFNNGSLEMYEQKRNEIGPEYVTRAVYEEEPAVAFRNILVSEFGEKISTSKDPDGDVRLKVEASIVGETGFPFDTYTDLEGNVRLRVESLASPEFDTIEISRNFTKDPVIVNYYLDSAIVKSIELTYDVDGDLIQVKRL